MRQYKCNKCNGAGCLSYIIGDTKIIHYCEKCKGIGYLTFIENIFGKDKFDTDIKSSHIRSRNHDKFKEEVME